MRTPIMIISPSTLPMIVKYHRGDDARTHARWLRVWMVLHTVDAYNAGELSEEDLHGFFDLAFDRDDAHVIDHATEILL